MTQEFDSSRGVARVTTSSGDTDSYDAAQRAQQEQKEQARFVSTSRVGSGVRSLTIGGESAPDGTFRSHSNDPAPVSSGNVLATARTPGGAPVARELRDTDTVDIGGMRTTVRAAIAAGFISRDALGSTNAPQREQQHQEKPRDWQTDRQVEEAREPEVEKLADLPAEAHNAVGEFNEKVGNIDRQRATRAMLEEGQMSDDLVRTVASQMGIEPDVLNERAAHVREEFLTQANQMVGPAADELFSWARANEPGMLKDAVRAHVYDCSPTAYVALERSWWLDMARNSPQSIMEMSNAKAVGARLEKNGVLTVEVPGAGRMAFAAAIHGGFTSIGKKKG